MKKRIKNILDYKIMKNLFQFSRQSWNNWKIEQRPVVILLEKYFTNADLKEFLTTGAVSKYEPEPMQPKSEDHPSKEPVKPKIGKEYKVAASAILGCTLASYYNWAKESRSVISFFEQYLSLQDLQEFIEFNKIQKFDDYKKFKESEEYSLFKEFIEFNKNRRSGN